MDHYNMVCLYLSMFFYRFHYVAVRMYMYLRGVETHNIFPIERYCSIKSSTRGKIVVKTQDVTNKCQIWGFD